MASRYYANFVNSLRELGNLSVVKAFVDIQEKFGKQGDELDVEQLEQIRVDENFKHITSTIFQVKSFAHITVVFSALCLESLINDYCSIKKSTNFLKDHIDKLDTPSKWLIIPKLITGKEISSDSIAYELLKELFKLRNTLVHPKSKTIEQNLLVRESIDLYLKKISRAYQTINKVTFELYGIDPTFTYLNEYKFFWDSSSKFINISDIESLYFNHFG